MFVHICGVCVPLDDVVEVEAFKSESDLSTTNAMHNIIASERSDVECVHARELRNYLCIFRIT